MDEVLCSILVKTAKAAAFVSGTFMQQPPCYNPILTKIGVEESDTVDLEIEVRSTTEF